MEHENKTIVTNDDLITPKEAAEILRCCETIAYRKFQEPGFPVVRINKKKKFVLRSSLYAWIKKQEFIEKGYCQICKFSQKELRAKRK